MTICGGCFSPYWFNKAVIVDDFNVESLTGFKPEADPTLVSYTDAGIILGSRANGISTHHECLRRLVAIELVSGTFGNTCQRQAIKNLSCSTVSGVMCVQSPGVVWL